MLASGVISLMRRGAIPALLLFGLLSRGASAAPAPTRPLAEDPAAIPLPWSHPAVGVHGLAWFKEDAPVLRRLPIRLKDTFREPVWQLAQSPSGGRIRFRTDATRLFLEARNPDASTMHHMTSVGQNGFDLYLDGRYLASAWPDAQGRIVREWTVGEGRSMREITLYLPLYKPVTVDRLLVEPGSTVASAAPFAVDRPVVFYGSSITQGGCAENPGLSTAAILGRRLGVDIVNLGFSGNGLGEPAVAQATAEIEASAYVLDFWANPSVDVYRETLPPFVETLRARHPQTPILVVSPFWFPAEGTSRELHEQQEAKRAFARDFVRQRRRAGDREVRFVDGLGMLSPAQSDGLVDGVHPNSIGFSRAADGLEPQLRSALGLGRRR